MKKCDSASMRKLQLLNLKQKDGTKKGRSNLERTAFTGSLQPDTPLFTAGSNDFC